jgi:hypothetical protein
MIRIIALAAVCPFLFAPNTPGQTNPDTVRFHLPPGIQVRMEATPKLATVGDPIRMDLEVTAPAGYQVELPLLDKQIGEFSIFEFKSEPAAAGAEKVQSPANHRAHIIASVYKTGSFTFPPVEVRLRTPEGKQIVVSSLPVTIEIQSVLSRQDRDLKNLKKQEEIPEPFRWALWLSILAALGAAGILAWILWRRRRAHKSHVPAVLPQDLMDVTEAELRELLARGLPEGSKVKPFYVLLSEIVKRILEAGFGIHTAERTTSEIMDKLRRGPGMDPEDMERIESFLLRCDIVKFAKYIPSKDEHTSAAEDALWVLECSRKAVGSRQSAVGNGVENI